LNLRELVRHSYVLCLTRDGPERRTGVYHGARLTAGHGELVEGAVQPAEGIPFTPRHQILDEWSGLKRTPSVVNWSTADHGLGPRRHVSASTIRVAHRVNQRLPRGCPVSSRVNLWSAAPILQNSPPCFW